MNKKNYAKRGLSIVLALLMLVASFAIPISAADEYGTGYSADRVTKVDLTNVVNINEYDSNTSATEFQITDKAGLTKLQTLVTNGTELFSGKTVYLANSIDLGGSATPWTPIGIASGSKSFKGTFDGQGNTIDGMYILEDGSGYADNAVRGVGLFFRIVGATVKNLVIGSNSSVVMSNPVVGTSSYLGTGAIAGQSDGTSTIDNCWNKANVSGGCQRNGGVGALVGWNYQNGTITIKNCTNTGTVESVGNTADTTCAGQAGGILGAQIGNATISNCRNAGEIRAWAPGAIVGHSRQYSVKIDACINNGRLVDTNASFASGGILSHCNPDAGYVGTVTNCTNYGEIVGDLADGGFAVSLKVEGMIGAGNSRATAPSGNKNLIGYTDTSVDPDDTELVAFIASLKPAVTAVGYSAKRVEKIDLSNVPDITAYDSNAGATAYKITNSAGMWKFQGLVEDNYNSTDKCRETFKGKTVYLANNVTIEYDSTNTQWTPIGRTSGNYMFQGTFDGQGYTISNLYIDVDGSAYTAGQQVAYGLFSRTQNSTFKNLIVEGNVHVRNATTGPQLFVSGIVTEAVGTVTVDNCWNKVNLSGNCNANGGIGGVVAAAFNSTDNITVKNCTNTGTIEATGIAVEDWPAGQAGGMVGGSKSNLTVLNCRNAGEIRAYSPGAMVGSVRDKVFLVDGCINNGKLVDLDAQSGSGGMIADVYNGNPACQVTITNCKNFGEIVTNGDFTLVAMEFGIAGSIKNTTERYITEGNKNLVGQVDSSVDADDTELVAIIAAISKVDSLLYIGVQNSATVTDGKYDLRFVGSIDSLDYYRVGFKIDAEWYTIQRYNEYKKSASTVFTSLLGWDGTEVIYTAEDLRGGGYLYAYTLKNIPTSVGKISFTVTPYYTLEKDSAEVYGTPYTVVYNAGTFVSSKANVAKAVSDDTVKNMTIVIPQGADSKVSAIATQLQNDINTALGVTLSIVNVSATDTLASYPNAIVIGAAGETATAMKNALPVEDGYNVKVDVSTSGTKVYIVGKTNLATVRAMQYFYSKSVVNGVFKIPTGMDTTQTANTYSNPLNQRDPGVITYNGKYYNYASTGTTYVVYESVDMLTWTGPTTVYDGSALQVNGTTANSYFWAPEVHYYNGAFYMFATCGYTDTSDGERGCIILKSDTPNGTFELISKDANGELGWITSPDKDYIDGTLYVDESGTPYMVFVYELTETSDGNGRMVYAQLSADLTTIVGSYTERFTSTDGPSVKNVVDGPWLYRTESGELYMIWSNIKSSDSSYCVILSKSSDGTLGGSWTHTMLFDNSMDNVYEMTDGGHGCIFRDLNGRLYLAIHTVNSTDDYINTDSENTAQPARITVTTFIPLVETDSGLALDLVKAS